MKAWFDGLAPRERLLVSAAAAAVVAFVAWRGIWTPLTEGTFTLRETVAQKARLVVDLQRAEGLGGTGGTASAAVSSQSLVVLVDTTARPYALDSTFTRRNPDGPNAISVSFERAAFDVLLAWLIDLEQTHGVRVDSVSFTGAREPGLVNGQVFLERS